MVGSVHGRCWWSIHIRGAIPESSRLRRAMPCGKRGSLSDGWFFGQVYHKGDAVGGLDRRVVSRRRIRLRRIKSGDILFC